MSVTSNLKKQVDLPVFEWMRPMPVATTSVAAFTSANTLSAARYIYYLVSSAFYRYDTIGDSWQQLANPVIAPATLLELGYSSVLGHYGRAISSGTGSNTIELAGFNINSAVGNKIRIISGKGAGQERTITAASAPIVKDRGVVTSGSITAIVDGSTGLYVKQWKVNQYRDHQVRIDYGTGTTQLRPIIYNSYNTLGIADNNWHTVTPWYGPTFAQTTNTTSLYQIESNILTVDTNWDVTPDSTSQFVIMAGGIWCISALATSGYSLQYYDVLGDYWYVKSSQANTFASAIGTDITFERFTESGGPVLSGAASTGSVRTLTDSLSTLTPLRYNNFEIRITGGTGRGQSRTILANNASTFFLTRDWDTAPDNTSTYAIYRDVGKLLISGNGQSVLGQYSLETDQMTTAKQLDFGVARVLSYALTGTGLEPIGSGNAGAKSTSSILTLNPVPTAPGSGYLVDQILTITTGGTGGTARVTSINLSGGVTRVTLEACGSSYTTGTGKATTVSPTGGTGCTLEITAISDIITVTTPINHNFRIGDNITITGIADPLHGGTRPIIGCNTVNTFQYAITGGGIPTSNFTQQTTNLYDITKNWVVNEHAGRMVQLSLAPSMTTGVCTTYQRRILSNTTNSLSVANIGATPSDGTWRYVIIDGKAFGVEQSAGAKIGNGTFGFATSGTTTSLTDNTKNWPLNYWSFLPTQSPVNITTFASGGTGLTTITTAAAHNVQVGQNVTIAATTNYNGTFAVASVTSTTVFTIVKAFVSNDATGNMTLVNGRKVRIISGTGAGREFAITSNTATTLNFLTQTFTPDTTTNYIIMENFGVATGGSATTLVDSSQNWPTNSLVNKRVRFLTGTGVGNEYNINSNTQNTLTFTAANTPDLTTQYVIYAMNPRGAGIHADCVYGCTDSNINNRYVYIWRGSGSPELTRYDFVKEEMDLFTYLPNTETLTTGSMYVYDGQDRIYYTKDATGRIYYYDVVKNLTVPFATIPYGMGTTILGNKMEIIQTEDGLKYLYIARHSGQELWRTLIYY